MQLISKLKKRNFSSQVVLDVHLLRMSSERKEKRREKREAAAWLRGLLRTDSRFAESSSAIVSLFVADSHQSFVRLFSSDVLESFSRFSIEILAFGSDSAFLRWSSIDGSVLFPSIRDFSSFLTRISEKNSLRTIVKIGRCLSIQSKHEKGRCRRCSKAMQSKFAR